jgi:putative endonuclease
VGLTSNLNNRMAADNAGDSSQTKKHRPWRVLVAIELDTEVCAANVERYLKSGSGRAFMKQHFLQG